VCPLATGPEAAVQKARSSVQSSRRRGLEVALGGFRVVYQIFVMGEWDIVGDGGIGCPLSALVFACKDVVKEEHYLSSLLEISSTGQRIS
jgi:hypothetical protein